MTPEQHAEMMAELREITAQLGHVVSQLDRVEQLGHEAHARIAAATTDLGPIVARFQNSKLAKLLGA